MRRLWWIGLAALGGIGALTAVALRQPTEAVETLSVAPPSASGPAMCPWRTPPQDMRAFFPGADSYRTQTLVLSGLRLPILQRLGPGTPLESNSLYVYPVYRGTARRGTVLVQRAAGRYGAMEVVVGVDPDGRVAGVRLQRYREPQAVADVIASHRWLGAFRGKTADSGWRIGSDIPAVPAAAQTSAEVIVRTVRALMIEFDVAQHNGNRK